MIKIDHDFKNRGLRNYCKASLDFYRFHKELKQPTEQKKAGKVGKGTKRAKEASEKEMALMQKREVFISLSGRAEGVVQGRQSAGF